MITDQRTELAELTDIARHEVKMKERNQTTLGWHDPSTPTRMLNLLESVASFEPASASSHDMKTIEADAERDKTNMSQGFEDQRKAGINVDWFTWQIAWHDALFAEHDVRAQSPVADAQAEPMSDWQTGLPPTKPGAHNEYILAVKRKQAKDPNKVFVFAANYANAYTDDDSLSDRDGKPSVADGWYSTGSDMSGEFSYVFEQVLNEGDVVMGWQSLPKWSEPEPSNSAAPAVAQAEAKSTPSTLSQQVASAQREVASWSPERHENVRLEGGAAQAEAKVSDFKRFSIDMDGEEYESPIGEWVRYEDVRTLAAPSDAGDAVVAAKTMSDADVMNGSDCGVALNRVVWMLADSMGLVPDGVHRINLDIADTVTEACRILAARESAPTDDDRLELLAKAHRAIDLLLAQLVIAVPDFRPTQSPVWPDLELIAAAVRPSKAGHG